MSRKKRRVKKSGYLVIALLLIIVGVIYILCNKNSNINKDEDRQDEVVIPSNYLNKINYGNYTLDKEVEDVIVEYMNLYYKSLYTLDYNDMSYLFSNINESNLNSKTMELLLYSRGKQLNDLSLSKAEYVLNITDVKDDGLTINFTEDNVLRFKHMDTDSYAYGISNTIKLEKTDDGYKIVSFRKIQDFYVMFTREVNDSYSNLDTLLSKYKKEIDESINKQEEYLDDYTSNSNVPSKECDHEYNREKALEFANTYVNSRSSDWDYYDPWGGNCQNYASIVIYEGGIPMDSVGSIGVQWKHFSSTPNENSEDKGRSYSWTTVSPFYEYAKYNKGYGLCSIVDINPYYAEGGDIAQVSYDDNWNHTVVIVGTVKKDGKVVDLMINSNTINLKNYPLSSYVYPQYRVIKIMGWNDK